MSMTMGVPAGNLYRPMTLGIEMHSGGEKPGGGAMMYVVSENEYDEEGSLWHTKRGMKAYNFHTQIV